MNSLLEKIRSAGTDDRSVIGGAVSSEHSQVKAYSLIATTTLLALLAGYLMATNLFAAGGLVLVIFTVGFLIQAIALRFSKEAAVVAVLNTIGFLAPFYNQRLSYLLATFAVVTLFFFSAVLRGQRSVENVIRIRFSQITRPVAGIVLAALTVLLSFVLFSKGDVLLGVGNVNRTIDLLVVPVAQGYIKDFSSSMTTGAALRGLAETQLNANSDFALLSASQKETAIRQYIDGFVTYVESKTGFELDVAVSVGENVQQLITAKASSVGPQNQQLRAVVFVTVLMLLVKSIEVILYIPLAVLAFILYQLLVASGFLVVQLEPRSKEVINMI